MKKLGEFLKNNPIFMLLFGLIVALFVILMVVSVKSLRAAKLEILVAPTSAEILIDGEKYQNGIYDGMEEGVYTVKILQDGFNTEEFQIELKSDETTKLYKYLKGNDGYYENHMEDLEIMRLVSEYEVGLVAQNYLEKYPIMKVLPLVVEKYAEDFTEYTWFRIDGGKYDECEKEFCLKITDMSGGNYEKALKMIQKKGFDPDDYKIIYEDDSKKGKAF